MRNPYNIGLDKNLANFQPLTPLSLLARTVAVYPHLTSTLYDGRSFTWAETYDRCRRLASCLVALGIGEGDTVAAMLPNVPAMHELHFAVHTWTATSDFTELLRAIALVPRWLSMRDNDDASSAPKSVGTQSGR